jgi:hypothetical protein
MEPTTYQAIPEELWQYPSDGMPDIYMALTRTPESTWYNFRILSWYIDGWYDEDGWGVDDMPSRQYIALRF